MVARTQLIKEKVPANGYAEPFFRRKRCVFSVFGGGREAYGGARHRHALCANDHETAAPHTFRLEGVGE